MAGGVEIQIPNFSIALAEKRLGPHAVCKGQEL